MKLINEVRRMQQLAGLLKENDATKEYVDAIVDMAASGAGDATGLNTSAFTNIVAKIKGENLIDAVSQALVKHIDSGEGFTQKDIDSLTAAGFNMKRVNIGDNYDDNY